MTRLDRSVRWALSIAGLGSLAWLMGCAHELLGWRGPGIVFLAWSVPALPVFVATADRWSRSRGDALAPRHSAAVMVWSGAMWWLAATPKVPGSPSAFVAASGGMIGLALAVLAWQFRMLRGLSHPAVVPVERRAHSPATRGRLRRRAAVATLIRAH